MVVDLSDERPEQDEGKDKMDNETLTMITTRLANESKQEEENARDSGASLGREWAGRIARPSELRRMLNADQDPSSWFALCKEYSSIEDNFGSRGRDLPDEHRRLIEDEELVQAFCEGFVEGAVSVWEEIQALPAADQGNGG
jgi:hypothetical protein